jgi:uncharacterized protein (DUF1810 family)
MTGSFCMLLTHMLGGQPVARECLGVILKLFLKKIHENEGQTHALALHKSMTLMDDFPSPFTGLQMPF